MKHILGKKIFSFVLALVLLVGVLPTSALAAFDKTGKPTDLANKICLSIYNGSDFPGEPAVYGTSNYTSFNSSFKKASSWFSTATFKDSATSELDPKILSDLQQGTSSGSTTVWGVYDAEGMKDYFLESASIIKPENELKIIQAIKGSSATLDQYEIIWYVIKFQASSSSWSGSSGEWHIDGTIKEKSYRAVHYYGNGNTTGSAPAGSKTITPNSNYTVLGNTGNLTKEVDGVNVEFLGWNTAADGSGTTYQPGDTIKITEDMSLYAMWASVKKYSVTVNNFLDGSKISASAIHGNPATFHITRDDKTYIDLTENKTGTYTGEVIFTGNYKLFYKDANGNLVQPVSEQITISNKDASLDVHHYSVSYDTNGGAFSNSSTPKTGIYHAGASVSAIIETPTKEGFDFIGWKDQNGTLIQPGAVITNAIAEKTTLTAQWETAKYNVVVSATTGGTATGNGTYLDGDEVTISATAGNGFSFLGWYEDGNLLSQEPTYSFTIHSDRTFTARFSKVYIVNAIAEKGGSTTGSGEYEPLSTATITAEAAKGYYFVGWYDKNNELVTAESSYTFNVKEDITFTAKFEKVVAYSSNYVYILGYEDNELGAEGPLLRSEVSQMIYRLVKQNGQLGGFRYSQANTAVFADTQGEWFRSGIEFLNYKGAFRKGKNVHPFVQVSRGETYKLICLGLGFTSDSELSYSDYATILYNSGHIDASGRDRISSKMTRWEFCTMFNKIIGRTNALLETADGTEITAETYGYTDLDPNAHYYKTMLRAASTYKNGYVDIKNRRDRNDLDDYSG